MTTGYRVEWLRARDSTQVARLERALHPPGQRIGLEEIEEDLYEADLEGANLSLGLYRDHRMVGYLLAYHERDRQRTLTYMGISKPEGLDLSGPGVYIADYAVLPRHRRAAGLLLEKFIALTLMRRELTGLPVDIICIEALLHYWEKRSKVAARFGYAIDAKHVFQPSKRAQPMYWLTFRCKRAINWEIRSPTLGKALRSSAIYDTASGPLRVGIIDSRADWQLLEPHWNELVRWTPHVTIFQTYEYLRNWWTHIGWPWDLRIFVALRGERVVGIAPMYIGSTWPMGRQLRCLTFLGQPSEADRPTLLASPDDPDVARCVADYIVGAPDLWDCLVLYEQNPDSVFYRAMVDRLRASRALISVIDAPVCAYVSTEGTWQGYLASLSKVFRKNIKRRKTQLEKAGKVEFEVCRSPDEADTAFETYLEVERASWKLGTSIGAGQSSPHCNFYRDLAQGLPDGAAMHFKFLRLNGRVIAATFGLLWQRCFYSLHIAHDQAFSEFSPGIVLTACEIEDAFTRREYDKLDFLGGFLTNKLSWSSGGVHTVALYADRRSVRSWLYHFVTFTVRPAVRRLVIRLGLLGPAQRLKKYLKSKFDPE